MQIHGDRNRRTIDEELKALHTARLTPMGFCQGGYLHWVVRHKGRLYQVLLHLRLKDLCRGRHHCIGFSEDGDDYSLTLSGPTCRNACCALPSCARQNREGSEQHASVVSTPWLIWPFQLLPLQLVLQAAGMSLRAPTIEEQAYAAGTFD